MLTFFYWLFPLFLFMKGGWDFVSKRKHLLLTLLSLEFIVLSLFLILFMYLKNLNGLNYELLLSMIVFLTFSVCEGALGLSILVSMIRTHGNDYFQLFSVGLLQC